MRPKPMTELIRILNGTDIIDEKRRQIYSAGKTRRGINRQLFFVVGDLLENYILPLRHDKEFQRYILRSADEQLFALLDEVLRKANGTYFRATCAEALWSHTHHRSYAEAALFAYWEELNTPSNDITFHFNRISAGICRIYISVKSPAFPVDEFIQKCTEFVLANIRSEGFSPLFVLEGLLACKASPDKVETALIEAIQILETAADYRRYRKALECLVNHYSKSNRHAEALNLHIKIAKAYEAEANSFNWQDSRSAHTVINLIQCAMKEWSLSKDSNGSEERKRLARSLEPVKALLHDSMQLVQSDPFDITDIVNNMKMHIEKSSFEGIVWGLAQLIHLRSINEIDAEMTRTGEGALSCIFSTNILDAQGRVKCIVPASVNPSPKELNAVRAHHVSQLYTTCADALILRYLRLAREKVTFTEENLSFLVENNAFIPEDRRRSFLKGLVSGFNLDLITAIPVLMPQMENAFRVLASEQCNAVVYKTYADGTEECLSLESVLDLPEVTDLMEEDFLFNAKVFLTSAFGFGMRDMSGHGLYSDAALQSLDGIAVWWYVLHICCLYSAELQKRLYEQATASEDAP